ncbi:MAG: response regulator, partial [Roseovarius sp.]
KAVEAAPGHDPDIILLDVMMPGLDGEETQKALRKLDAYRDKTFDMLTAKASQADNAALMEAGAVEVIYKPFDPMTLPDQLRAILSR